MNPRKTMTGRSLLLLVLSSSLESALVCADHNIVAPNNLGYLLEGEGSSTRPFFIEQTGVSSMRYQQIYDAAQFSAVNPGGEYIREIDFRPDSSVMTVGTWITNIQINF